MNRWLWSFWPASRNARVFLVILIVVAAVLIGFFALRAKKPRPSFDTGNIALKLRKDQIEKLNQDSDHDGLKDWEEILYHTDPRNSDTDGDGTLDGEEVKLGRDPTKPNTSKNPGKPNDLLATSTPLTNAKGDAGGPNVNLTADFARSFLRQPLAQLMSGEQADIDTKAVERYADQLKWRSVLTGAQRFTTAAIKINPAIDDKTILQYTTSVQNIFKVLGSRGHNELEVIAEALTNQDYAAITEISSYPDAYQKAINNLVVLDVPKSFIDFHLSILNHLSKFKLSTELLQTIETDPILAILVINERLRLDEEFRTYLVQSAQKIADKTKK